MSGPHPAPLKRFAMASPSAQYFFGEFSDDEFKEFFVTARCTVELPPFNETVLCSPRSTSDLQDGEEYQRIEFGINEVIDTDVSLLNNTDYSISSTLNPQAPEFILGCTPAQKTHDDILHENNYDTIDCQFTDSALPQDNGGNADNSGNADSDGTSGIGQRERKKKKKRPPGYYSYLEDVGDGSVPTEALVNGHANSSGLNSISTDEAEFAEDIPISSASPRTCNSPDNSVDFNNEALSDDASFSNALDDARTAGQPEECSVTNSEQSCIPSDSGRESPVRTAVVQPFAGIGTDTTENLAVTNGQTLEDSDEGPASNGVEFHTEGETTIEQAKPEESSATQSVIPISGSVFVNPPAKSWASLFHNSKPSPSTQVAYVETKYSPPATTVPVPEKQVEVKEGPVPVSEDSVAIKIAAPGEKVVRDIRPGAAFEPTYIYRLLTVTKSSLSEKGRQEDAEEYLGFILNGLHEEMLSLKKLLFPQNDKMPISNGPDTRPEKEEDEVKQQDEQGEGSEEEWEQVGPRNKSSVTRQADFVQTLITDIFGGHMRSVVYQQSSKESATLQPFFTLQLDIQSDKIRTVQEALESLVARESVQGYTTKTKQEVEISRRVTLEELPPVLVLHLKRFVFEKTGGCQKLIKNIEYPVDLEISKDLLSPGVKSKIFKVQRTYRLFAVVYHHGNSATGGHYTTDVFQIGLNGWLRIDDQTVKVINQYQVVKQTVERTAYLLYYRRVDLL
ncbi:hypothetical protein FKM82_003661 [Ascaphus truei]